MKPRWEGKAVLGLLILGLLLPLGVTAELDETDLESDMAGDWESNIDQSVETEEVLEETEEAEEEVLYATPKAIPSAYLMETFDDMTSFENTWVKSEAKKEGVDEDIAKYDGVWAVEAAERMPLTGDRGLILKSKAKHAAIAAPLKKPFTFNKKPLVVQYEVNMQNGQECGGSYIKLISASKGRVDLKNFHDKTPYTIMFGPDKCGNDHKLHFIFRHVNPLTGEIEEKHAKRPRDKIEEPFKDKKSHLYTLVIRPDNTFDINLDHELISSGSLLEDFTPPVNPPKEIDDPEDFMPEDWDEREKIPDPEATKPDDWDEEAPMQIADPVAEKPSGWLDEEPEMIPDPTAEKPEDWDDEMDGEWEAALISNPVCADAPGCGEWRPPMVDNPEFKGKWRPPMIDNPNYRGKWKPRKIPNPDFFEDLEPFKMTAIDAVGLELWSMSDNILFDNFLITDNIADANQFAAETYDLKVMKIEKGSWGYRFKRLGRWMNVSPWFWPAYCLFCASPVLAFFVFLTWWVCHEKEITLWEKILKLTNYKPIMWTLYLMYLIIPAGILIYCLGKRLYETGVFRRIINYSNKNPWLYGIYVLLVAIPVVLIFAFCCAEAKDSKDDKAAQQKKTDEPSPDDPQSEEADSNPTAADDDAPVSGSDAEGDEDKAEDEEDKEDEEEEGEEEEEEEKAEETEEVQTRTSPRLRKSRRE